MCDFGCGSQDSNSNSFSNGQFNTTGNQSGTSASTSSTSRNLPAGYVQPFNNFVNGTFQAISPFINGQGSYQPQYSSTAANLFGNFAFNGNPTIEGAKQYLQNISTIAPKTLSTIDQNTGQVLNTNYNPISTVNAATPNGVSSATGAAMSAPYQSLYSQQLIDPSLQAFDYGTDRAMSALDARTAGAGAFANSRSGLGYSDLGTQAALQRGQLESQLKSQGLNSAFGLGQTDAARQLQADQGNQQAQLATNLANAAAGNNTNTFNANMQNNRDQFDINSMNNRLDQKTAETLALAGITQGQNAFQSNNAAQLGNVGQSGVSNFVSALAASGVPIQAILQMLGTNTNTTGQTNVDTTQSGTTQGSTTGNSSTSGFKFGF